jgi:hypothetical protein
MSGWKVQIDSSSLAEVNSLLLGISDGARKVLVNSLNETVKKGKKVCVDTINSVVTLKKTPMNKEIRYNLASLNQAAINASITATGKRQKLINYSVQQTQKGVSVQIYRNKPREIIKTAFIATMKSGHKGVYERKTSQRGKGTPTGKLETRWGALPRQYRLPIEELYSQSVEDWFGHAEIMQQILFQLGELTEQELKPQVDELMREVA